MTDQAGRFAATEATFVGARPRLWCAVQRFWTAVLDAVFWLFIVLAGVLALSPRAGLLAASETIAARRALRRQTAEIGSAVWVRQARRNAAKAVNRNTTEHRPIAHPF